MTRLGLHDLWLFCTIVQTMALLRTPPTYTKLWDRIQRDTRDAVARQALWRGDLRDYTLRRCVERVQKHFGRAPLEQSPEGVLTLTSFGKSLATLFQPTVEQMLPLYRPGPPLDQLKVRVADTIACEVLPGALCRLPSLETTASCFLFRRMDYVSLDEEIHQQTVAFGLGWRVAAFAGRHTERVPLSDALPLVFVGSRRELFGPEPHAEEIQDAIKPAYPLFIVRGELGFPGQEEMLDQLGFGPDRVVEVVNFQAVLTHARCGDGVGVVPWLPWVLDPLRDQEQIGYTAVPAMAPQHIMGYLPRGGEEKLDVRARNLVGAVKDNLKARVEEARQRRQDRERAQQPAARRKGRGSR